MELDHPQLEVGVSDDALTDERRRTLEIVFASGGLMAERVQAEIDVYLGDPAGYDWERLRVVTDAEVAQAGEIAARHHAKFPPPVESFKLSPMVQPRPVSRARAPRSRRVASSDSAHGSERPSDDDLDEPPQVGALLALLLELDPTGPVAEPIRRTLTALIAARTRGWERAA